MKKNRYQGMVYYRHSIAFFFVLFVLTNSPVFSQRVTGSTSYFCAFCHKGPYSTYEAARAHTCAVHNYLCAPAPVYNPGPSAAELKKQREEKDLKEACEDSNDKGLDCFNKKDWAGAIKYFKEALDYWPDNDDVQYNLKVAQQQLEIAQMEMKQKEEEQRLADLRKKEEEMQKISVKTTSTELISNLKNTEEGINTGNLEKMKDKSGKVFDTKGDNRGALADVYVTRTITPAQEKAAREYLAKNDKDYQARQLKLEAARKKIDGLKEKDDALSKTIRDYKDKYGAKPAPKEELDKYTTAIKEQQTIKGQLWNEKSVEKQLEQKDMEAIKKYVSFSEKKIPGQ